MISLRFANRLRPILQNSLKCIVIAPFEQEQALSQTCFLFQHQSVRSYAKQKDKLKEKARNKGVKFARIELNEDHLRTIINLDGLKGQCQKALDTMQQEYIKNLSLRSTTGSIENLKVTVDGREHELQELAQIIRKNPKTIVMNMVAFPQAIPAALQALQKSGMNLNPQQDGTTIFIPVPKVTKEHREGLAKNAKMLYIKCRDAIRDVQNQTNKKVKKNTEISEDENHNIQRQVISIADTYIEQADKMLATKQEELIGNEK